MKTPVGDPHFPDIIGFDLPASDAAGEQTLTALLDVAPARVWMDVFAQHVQAFVSAHALSDLRVVGRTLTAIGPIQDGRRLAADIKALIHRISRQRMQRRMVIGAGEHEASWPLPRTPREPALLHDLAAISGMSAVPALLEAVSRATGMRFVAIARVTDDRWTACAVYDLIEFGLRPGQDLVLETTICNEIRVHHTTVAFDRASAHPVFAGHPTPAMYGFESYVSVPILREDGSFFGTLCALDPQPALLDEATLRALEQFAAMIGRQLPLFDAQEAAAASCATVPPPLPA